MHKVIKILISASLFYNFAGGLFGPIYAIFVEKIGGDILTASSAIALYNIIIGILILTFSRIEDRINKRNVVVLGYFLSAIGVTGYLFVSQPWHLFVVQTILSFGAITNPAWDALFAASTDKRKESEEWGLWEGSIKINAGIAALIGGFIASFLGFRTLFVLMSASTFASAFASTLLLRKKTWKGFLNLKI